jgi:adenylate kinase
MNIILLGAQGSGKGTQAQLLAEHYNLLDFDAGVHLREIAKGDAKINHIINELGTMIPDDQMFSIVSKELQRIAPTGKNILFDGYPRAIRQYQLTKAWLLKRGSRFDAAIYIDIADKESIKRLSGRRVCVTCGLIYNLNTNPPPSPRQCSCGGKIEQRPDDTPKAIKARLKAYHTHTRPLLTLLSEEGILIEVNGMQPIETVFKDIVKKIGV